MALKDVIDIANGRGVCSAYRHRIACVSNKRQFVDLMFSAQGVEYMRNNYDLIEAHRELFIGEFGRFLNGGYRYNSGSYSVEVYYGYSGKIRGNMSLVLLMNCGKTYIDIPENYYCRVIAVNSGDVSFIGKGRYRLEI